MPDAPPVPPHIVREIVIKARVSYLDETTGLIKHADWTQEIPVHEAKFTPDIIALLKSFGLTLADRQPPTS